MSFHTSFFFRKLGYLCCLLQGLSDIIRKFKCLWWKTYQIKTNSAVLIRQVSQIFPAVLLDMSLTLIL